MFNKTTLLIFTFSLSPVGANAGGDITAAGKLISSAGGFEFPDATTQTTAAKSFDGNFVGDLSATGKVKSSSGGFEFPDATIQTTAATSAGNVENQIIVATSGGDFSSVAEALNSITTNSSNDLFHVLVGPGVYSETETLHVKDYVHLEGSGPNVTRIESNVNGTAVFDTASWAAMLHDNGRISNLTLVNNGDTAAAAVGVGISGITDTAVLDNVDIRAVGTRTTGTVNSNIAVYINDVGPRILNSRLTAYGRQGSTVSINSALSIVGDGNGGDPQPIVRNSNLYGGKEPISRSERTSCAGNTLSGTGIYASQAAPLVYNSVICGDYGALTVQVRGNMRIHNSVIKASSTFGAGGDNAHLTNTTGSGSIIFKGSELWHLDTNLGQQLSTDNVFCLFSTHGGIIELDPDCTTP